MPAKLSQFAVMHDQLEMPLGENGQRHGQVDLSAGGVGEVTVALAVKSKEPAADTQVEVADPNCANVTNIPKPRPKRIFTTECARLSWPAW